MDTKLTLNIDKTIIDKAKAHAKNQGRSLSDLVENLLTVIVSDKKTEYASKERKISPEVRALRGAIKAPKNINYKEEYRKYIIKKYSK
ncbi:MAG: hypothetical protein EHM58_08465 [Ignavibacteriae bacterium]|nr:MAG: hypothetical protein EHM58_08465 [Ignavibacteriota bacterium]